MLIYINTVAGGIAACVFGFLSFLRTHRIDDGAIGRRDGTVLTEESKKMVDAINKRGGNAKLTLYPEAGHDSWTATYTNRAVYEWLLSHKNENAKALVNEYADGSDKFG